MTTESRATRRQVRVRCWIVAGHHEAIGTTTNLSVGGLSLRLPLDDARSLALETGRRVSLRLLLPRTSQVSVEGTDAEVSRGGTIQTGVRPEPPLALEEAGEVVWLDREDRDPGGAPVLGIGLQFADPSADSTMRIASFLREFQYSVVLTHTDPADLELLKATLSAEFRLITCRSAAEAMAVLRSNEVAVLIIGDRGSEVTGPELLQRIRAQMPGSRIETIALAHGHDADEIRAYVNGGRLFSHLRTPISPEQIALVVDRAAEAYSLATENERLQAELQRANSRLRRENAYLRQKLAVHSSFETIVGQSPALRDSLAQLERIRRSDATVYLHGETGTGKELVARALHEGGPRASGPFVAQNCAGMTESLLHSTLFGHVRGAFTGAHRDRPGVFQEADNGTLFLDEIGDLSPAVQASLLRTLQEGEVVPVGATRPIKVNVRIISATHVDLKKAVETGRFREDLYFRLVVISVRIPPLRDRTGDVPLLARHFLDIQCDRHAKDVPGFTADAIRALEKCAWPGNIRQLQNEIERLVVLAEEGKMVDAASLSPDIAGSGRPVSVVDLPMEGGFDRTVEAVERALIERALQAAGGAIGRAAEILGMERSRLGKIRRRLGLAE